MSNETLTKEQAAAAIAEILKPFRVEGRDQWERDDAMLDIIATVFHDIDVSAICICPQCFIASSVSNVLQVSSPTPDSEDDEGDSIDEGVSVDRPDGEPTNADLDRSATLLACAVTVEEAKAQAEHLRNLRERRTRWDTQDDIDLRDHIDRMLAGASETIANAAALNSLVEK